MILIDSNIFIDIIGKSQRWQSWSDKALIDAASSGQALINAVIAAEISPQFMTVEQLEEYLGDLRVSSVPLSMLVAFRAGRAHSLYRSRGGTRQAILADFLIGAHAESLGARLLTRDPKRYMGYFPTLNLITPESHP